MKESIKKFFRKKDCVYCGEAQVNHTLYFLDSFLTNTMDTHAVKVIKYVPNFIKRFVDLIPPFLFKTLSLVNIVKFSEDVEKARSFRSRVIWEEATRRGIKMEQIIFNHTPLDFYRAFLNGKYFYFESIPIKPEFLDMDSNWDDKIVLKRELQKHNVPVPAFLHLPIFNLKNLDDIFSQLEAPVIVKPKIGSRARHTVTNINTKEQFKKGVELARQISAYIVAEEHLDGYICRATVVDGKLGGFYRGSIPIITGDGQKTIHDLIQTRNGEREERYSIRVSEELHDHIERAGFNVNDVLPEGVSISLSHRGGQLFGGNTKEMIDDLHPSFIPIFERAASAVGLAVAGFDAIIPDPTKDASSQKWGIIECNTLPFIDVHYFALEGKPRNIAGMVWDMWS